MSFDQSLRNHIQNILKIVFTDQSERITVTLFDNKDISILKEFEVKDKNFDYLILIEIKEIISDLEGKISQLSKLLNKEIYINQEGHKTTIHWFEGLNTPLDILNQEIDFKTSSQIEKLKSETHLPAWLDKFIFDNLQALYAPDYDKFDYNLEHSKEELLIYLGTYFPRSYAESFCIFDDLFKNSYIKTCFDKKEEINILDIGSGSGGNLIGLITAINKNLNHSLYMNIWAIDGNKEAIELSKEIIHKHRIITKHGILFNSIHNKFSNIDQLSTIINTIPCDSFDIITSFKTVGEIISKDSINNCDFYYELTDLSSRILSKEGFILILDVTIKTKNYNYLPILLNEQARRFIQKNLEFKILSPLSCNYYGSECNSQCFYQHDFFISHQKKHKDISRVAYKIICKKTFVNNITINLKNAKFVINWRQFNNPQKNNGCCFYSQNKNEYIDAYKIS